MKYNNYKSYDFFLELENYHRTRDIGANKCYPDKKV